jgi:hypothetical protein
MSNDDIKKEAAELAARRRTPLTAEQAKERFAAVEAAARNGASTDEIAAAIMRSGLSVEELERFLNNNNEGFIIYHG